MSDYDSLVTVTSVSEVKASNLGPSSPVVPVTPRPVRELPAPSIPTRINVQPLPLMKQINEEVRSSKFKVTEISDQM